MIHLRILTPENLTARTLEILDAESAVTNIFVLRGAARRPEGDMILCDVASTEASDVISDLRELGIDREGSIAVEAIEAELSRFASEAERAAPGTPSDAIVWEELETRTSESTELSLSYLVFMIIAVLIAAVGIYEGSTILIVGAMIVGPDFGPIAGVCVAAMHLRPSQAGRSFLALLVGYAVGILAACLATLILSAEGIIPQHFESLDGSLARSIASPGFFTLVVALLAGAAGMLSLASPRSAALIGVLVSVTTIPAAAHIAVTVAYGQEQQFWGSMRQLAINVGAMIASGTATLVIQRALYRLRHAAHLRELAHRAQRDRSPERK